MEDQVLDWLVGFYDLNPVVLSEEDLKQGKKANTLEISRELLAMDMRDMDFYKNLSAEHKKEINMWLLMRYMSSSIGSAEHHLMMVNDLVNNNFTNIYKHPELQWKLLALCGTGKKQDHQWLAVPKGIKKNKLEEEIMKFFPLLNDNELELFLKLNNEHSITEFLKENGYSDKEIKELFKNKPKGK